MEIFEESIELWWVFADTAELHHKASNFQFCSNKSSEGRNPKSNHEPRTELEARKRNRACSEAGLQVHRGVLHLRNQERVLVLIVQVEGVADLGSGDELVGIEQRTRRR